jgi:hypothetical protein
MKTFDTTINDPNGKPYISVNDLESSIMIHLHAYDPKEVNLVLDKRCIPELVDILKEFTYKKRNELL